MNHAHHHALRTFGLVLEQEGFPGCIRFLNKRVLHRFTALYRLDGDVMRVAHMLDKEGSKSPFAFANVPLTDGFCQFAIRDGGFVTSNAAMDERLSGHKYQHVVASYAGLALHRTDGRLWGTLFHMDLVPRPINNQELEFMQQAACMLKPGLPGF